MKTRELCAWSGDRSKYPNGCRVLKDCVMCDPERCWRYQTAEEKLQAELRAMKRKTPEPTASARYSAIAGVTYYI